MLYNVIYVTWRGCRYGDFYNAWKTMHRFAQLMGIKKKIQNPVIHTSRSHKYEIEEA